MKTPAQYEHDINDLAGRLKDAPDAKNKASLLTAMLQLEGQLVMDIRSLSTQFRSRAVSQIASATSKTGKDKASIEHRLSGEQHTRLDPYEKLLEKLKALIAELK